MLNMLTIRPIKIDGHVVAPPCCAKLSPKIIARQIPDSKIMALQIASFLSIFTFKGRAVLPQIMSYGYGAREATISA